MKTQFCLNEKNSQGGTFDFSLIPQSCLPVLLQLNRGILEKPIFILCESPNFNLKTTDRTTSALNLVSLEIYFTICFSFMLGYILTST
ncbi:MAG: hypothetical protein ABL927_03500 [Bdellovibrionales bacterium]